MTIINPDHYTSLEISRQLFEAGIVFKAEKYYINCELVFTTPDRYTKVIVNRDICEFKLTGNSAKISCIQDAIKHQKTHGNLRHLKIIPAYSLNEIMDEIDGCLLRKYRVNSNARYKGWMVTYVEKITLLRKITTAPTAPDASALMLLKVREGE